MLGCVVCMVPKMEGNRNDIDDKYISHYSHSQFGLVSALRSLLFLGPRVREKVGLRRFPGRRPSSRFKGRGSDFGVEGSRLMQGMPCLQQCG